MANAALLAGSQPPRTLQKAHQLPLQQESGARCQGMIVAPVRPSCLLRHKSGARTTTGTDGPGRGARAHLMARGPVRPRNAGQPLSGFVRVCLPGTESDSPIGHAAGTRVGQTAPIEWWGRQETGTWPRQPIWTFQPSVSAWPVPRSRCVPVRRSNRTVARSCRP